MDTKTIIGLILGSSVIGGVISGLIAQGAPWLREKMANDKTAAFSALRHWCYGPLEGWPEGARPSL